MVERQHRITSRIDLPGGQDRLRQLILYVAQRCASATYFGKIKLNKIIWKSDFDAYAERGVPVTGRAYQRLVLGPAAKEMKPIYTEMVSAGMVKVERRDFGDDIVEERTIALFNPNMKWFDGEDIGFIERSIDYYWLKTGTETSDDSHGLAWLTRGNGEPMPYESALLSDRRPQQGQLDRMQQKVRERGLISR